MSRPFRSILLAGRLLLAVLAVFAVPALASIETGAAETTAAEAALLQLDPADAGTIEGTVLDEEGQPVAGAEVQIPDLRLRTTTDSAARFSFGTVPPGSYLVEAFSAEKGSGLSRVTVARGGTAEASIVLELSHVRDSVVVTASAEARSLLELAQPTTVVGGELLALRMQPSLGETLAQEPGINSTFFGMGASRPVIRGLDGDRVRMLQGGIGTGDVSGTSPDHAVSADPMTAERIEVLRGPSTLLYGSSAIGGVVNVLDGAIPEFRPTDAFSGSVSIRGGTVADERTGAVTLEGGQGNWAWHVDLLSRDTDDYDIPGFAEAEGAHEEDDHEEEEHEEEEEIFGTVPNSDLETDSGTVGFSYFFGDRGFVGVSVGGFESQYGLPGGHGHGHEEGEEEHEGEEHEHEGEEEEEEEIIRLDVERTRFDLRGESLVPFGPFRGMKLRAGIVDYEHVELEGEEVGTLFLNDSFEGRLEFVQKKRGNWSGSLGVQFISEDLEAIGEEAFIPPTESTDWALFTFQEVKRGELSYQFGGRFESSNVDTRSSALPDRSFDGLSASAGIVWQPREDYSIGASLARSVKAPNGQELFADGLHVATQAFEIGDADLGEETSLGLDLFFRKLTGRLTGEVNFFTNQFDDFIFQAFTGDEEEGFPVILYSQADADFVGAEIKARYGLYEGEKHHLDLELSGDVVRAELDSGENLPRIPPLRLSAGLHYHGGPLQGLVEVRWIDDQDRLADNETPTDGYTLVNASVGYRFILGNQLLDVLLRGTNLTDEDARNHVSFLKDTVPLPGRDFGLSVRLWF